MRGKRVLKDGPEIGQLVKKVLWAQHPVFSRVFFRHGVFGEAGTV